MGLPAPEARAGCESRITFGRLGQVAAEWLTLVLRTGGSLVVQEVGVELNWGVAWRAAVTGAIASAIIVVFGDRGRLAQVLRG